MQLLYWLYQACYYFIRLVTLAIFVSCILSWVAPRSGLQNLLQRFIEPFVAPFRRLSWYLMNRYGGRIDLSYWFAMIGLNLLWAILQRLFIALFRASGGFYF